MGSYKLPPEVIAKLGESGLDALRQWAKDDPAHIQFQEPIHANHPDYAIWSPPEAQSDPGDEDQQRQAATWGLANIDAYRVGFIAAQTDNPVSIPYAQATAWFRGWWAGRAQRVEVQAHVPMSGTEPKPVALSTDTRKHDAPFPAAALKRWENGR